MHASLWAIRKESSNRPQPSFNSSVNYAHGKQRISQQELRRRQPTINLRTSKDMTSQKTRTRVIFFPQNRWRSDPRTNAAAAAESAGFGTLGPHITNKMIQSLEMQSIELMKVREEVKVVIGNHFSRMFAFLNDSILIGCIFL